MYKGFSSGHYPSFFSDSGFFEQSLKTSLILFHWQKWGSHGVQEGPEKRTPVFRGSDLTSERLSCSIARTRLAISSIFSGFITRIDKVIQQGQQGGAVWNGETEVMSRLISPFSMLQSDGTTISVSEAPIPWAVFTLQDAIDFAIFAVKVTMDTMRFLAKVKTVGGPVDVLIIKPGQGNDRAAWIQKKELSGDDRSLAF
jgi:hypothetical protein